MRGSRYSSIVSALGYTASGLGAACLLGYGDRSQLLASHPVVAHVASGRHPVPVRRRHRTERQRVRHSLLEEALTQLRHPASPRRERGRR